MKLYSVALGAVAASALLIGGCGGSGVVCRWADRPIALDARDDDWQGTSGYDVKEIGATLSLSNDASNLYALVKFKDPRWLHFALRQGFTLWLDETNSGKKVYGLKLTGPGSHGAGQGWNGPPRDMARPPETPPPPSDTTFTDLKVAVVSSPEDVGFSLDGTREDLPRIRIGAEHGEYLAELAVPLKAGGGGGLTLDAKPGSKVSLFLDMKRPRFGNWGKRRGGEEGGEGEGAPGEHARHGGFEGRGGEGMGGHGGHGGEGGMRPGGPDGDDKGRAADEDQWVKFKLAIPPKQAK